MRKKTEKEERRVKRKAVCRSNTIVEMSREKIRKQTTGGGEGGRDTKKEETSILIKPACVRRMCRGGEITRLLGRGKVKKGEGSNGKNNADVIVGREAI